MTLKLNGSSSGYTAIDAPAAAGSNTLTLPANNGSNGQFLQTNGSGALSFATVATESNLPCFFATSQTEISLTANSWAKIDFGTEVIDSATAYDHSTNHRFTPQTAGYYYVWGAYTTRFESAAHWAHISVYKNGSAAFQQVRTNGRNSDYHNWVNMAISGIVSLNGSSDYIELWATNQPDSGTTTLPCVERHFGAFRIGPNS